MKSVNCGLVLLDRNGSSDFRQSSVPIALGVLILLAVKLTYLMQYAELSVKEKGEREFAELILHIGRS